jgi:dynein heavy chain
VIKNTWKALNFEVREYHLAGQVVGYTIKGTDEIKVQLEDDIMTLQGVGASKYSRSVKKKVAQWEQDLNKVFDVIQAWLNVQRQWLYLLAIFASEDIRIALPEEAKKFSKTDTNYKKIMDMVFKSRNVLNCCVQGEAVNRLDELQAISRELDKCEKSLVSYLEDKRVAFPRFYFISDEDLLTILGTSDPQAIQPHLLKLFDNCAHLTFAQGGKVIT